MIESTSVASFRRLTPAIVASSRLAMANDVPDTTKSEIALLLKRAAPILGIDGTTYHVMDILLGLSRADDWKGAGRPIVAISNAKLAEYTMRSERTVIRCLRRLVEAGLAAYKDSSTGRRFVYRNEQGEITAGYGIDFTPARVRASELKVAVAEYQQKLNRDLAARRDISRLPRAIEDLCRAFPEFAADWRSRVEALQGPHDDLETQAVAYRTLHSELLAECTLNDNLTCEGDISVTPITNTIPESYYVSRKERTRSSERNINSYSVSKADEEAFEKKPADTSKEPQRRNGEQPKKDSATVQSEVLASVSIGLLQVACRQAQSMVDARFDSWNALGRAGEFMRRMIGLSEAGWADGLERVGLYAASAILATVLEKSLRDGDQISKPAGYFRAMIDRAGDGKLNLERSLFGLADGAY